MDRPPLVTYPRQAVIQNVPNCSSLTAPHRRANLVKLTSHFTGTESVSLMQPPAPLADESLLNTHISDHIRAARLRLGLSQRQIEIALGMAESTFSRYESGQRVISAAALCRIAAVLKLPPSDLLPSADVS
jgi:DNA-binding transcriptional regulator YiaG